MPDCPPDADLAGFLDEALPPDRMARLAAHVDGCPACHVRLDRFTHEADGPAARYKELSSVFPATRPGGAPPGPALAGANPPSGVRLTGLPRVPGFEVLAEIGRGGMGVVYKARHRRLNRPVALKMILAGAAADARTVQRFLFEGETLARVQHPQVVQVFEVGTYQGPGGVPIPYLAIELLEGGSLARRLKAGRVSPWEAVELVEGVARAVHAAHLQGVVHRDLKPGNILFPESGVRRPETGDRKESSGSEPVLSPASCLLTPKVTDFGLAKFIEAGADLTGSGQVIGTPHYMSPEQAAGGRAVGPAADVYALGAILFECLTEYPPFPGDEPVSVLLKVVNDPPPDVRDLRPDVPRDVAAVVLRCLAKDPRQRYASAEELADDLRRFLDNRPTLARPLRPSERVRLWARRNPATAVLVGLMAVLLVVGFGLVTWLWLMAEQALGYEKRATELAWLAVGEGHKVAAELRRQKEYAEQQQAAAEGLRALADRRGAELEFARAVHWCEEGRVRDGLRLFEEARALAAAVGDADLARAARVNLVAWARELPPSARAYTHNAQPRLAAFHPDGRHMATAGRGGEIYLWNLETRRPTTYRRAVRGTGPEADPPPDFVAVAVSPDGGTVAAGGSDGRITLWAADSPEPCHSFDAVGAGEAVVALGFTSDKVLWATDGRAGVKRWDVSARPYSTTHLTPAAGAKAGAATALAVSHDGKRVYTGDEAGVVREWDAEARREGRSWPAGGPVRDLAVSPDGTRVAATGPGGTVRVIAPAGDRPPLDLDLGGAAGSGVAFAPTRPLVLATDGDGNVRGWHRDTGLPCGLPVRLSGEVGRPRFRPGLDEFAVPAGNAVILCPAPAPPAEVLSAGRGSPVRGLDFSPAGDRLAAADEHALEVFDPTARKAVQTLEDAGRATLALRFDPDPARGRVFRGFKGGFDRLAVPGGRKAEPVPSAGLGPVGRFAFVRNDGLVVADQARIVRWDAKTLKATTATNLTADAPVGVDIRAVAARRDGAEVLASFGNRVVFLDPDTLRPARDGWTAGAEILDAAYTPDGSKVLVGRRDSVAELRDARTGAAAARPMPHAGAVTAVAVSPDGTLLATGGRDGTARFWDAATGLPLGPPLRHPKPVTHLAFAPDGKHLATGTAAGHVTLWPVPPSPAAEKADEKK